MQVYVYKALSIIIPCRRKKYIVYYGREDEIIPYGVTHVRVDSSVKTIKDYAFNRRFWLTTVTLCNGLEEIGKKAFKKCDMLRRIVIPNAVRTIQEEAFSDCTGLKNVTLGDGLEEIGSHAFGYCTSLREIVIPNAVKVIKHNAFSLCTGLTTVTLGDGLEEIQSEAFNNCTSLQRIVIPPAVKEIDDNVFRGCTNLTNVEFCRGIEELVSCEAMRDWWNGGVHELSLRTYCLLIKFNVPNRLALIQARSWRVNIYDMLGSIPTYYSKGIFGTLGFYTIEGLNSLFVSIDSKLTIYENMSEAPMLLERAIPNDDIVQLILSFL